MPKAAVEPSRGIGDALLMMVASHQLLKAGYEVTTFHPHLGQLQRWFPGHRFSSEPLSNPASFDLVILENDNSPRIKKGENVSVFYPTYSPAKHGALSPLDQVFDAEKPMAENIAVCIADLLKLKQISKDNGLTVPENLIHRLHEKRILIHPTSSAVEKNWTKEKYLRLAKHLEKRGYNPLFAVHAEESAEWNRVPAMVFSHLDPLACFLYESRVLIGNDSLLGHLASNLDLPTVILANDAKRMRLWRPGWRPGAVLTPPDWAPKRYWKHFISVRKVLRAFPP